MKRGLVEGYERCPDNLQSVFLTKFTDWYCKTKTEEIIHQTIPKIIRYCNNEKVQLSEYKHNMVSLHIPFTNEILEFLVEPK